ncbi:MAG: C39 family peptidase [Halobacteriota archaeon]
MKSDKKMAILVTAIIVVSLFTAVIPGLAAKPSNTLVSAEPPVPIGGGTSNTQNPYLVRTSFDEEGRQIDEIIVPGRPPEIKAEVVMVPEPHIAMGINVLSTVPAFNWSYGCSATSAAMMFGYYDNADYTNMYAGPTNGGACPMDNSIWGAGIGGSDGECPLSATHQGKDGLTTRGHVDDYWYSYGSSNDPYYDNWTEHGYANCTADFMGTNQYHNWHNTDGATIFYFYTNGAPLYDHTGNELFGYRDGCHGMRLFVESRGYNVFHDGTNYQNYNQYIHEYVSGGFTFEQFKAEINAGRPVIIQVEGHSMLGYGYNTVGNKVYIHDTWDHSDHQMTWGGTYSGLRHYGVTVIQIKSLPVITSCTQAGNEMNQFAPNTSVYVKGSGLDPNTNYTIWIQNDPVDEGKALTTGEDPSGLQETVTTGPGNGNPSGGFPATEIWSIPQNEPVTHHPYDIVVDKVGDGEGTYNSANDGIDSASVAGFVAPVPELPTIILFGVGLLALAGYVRLREKRE